MKFLLTFLFCAFLYFIQTANAQPPRYLATTYSDYDSKIGDLYLLRGERDEILGLKSIERSSKLTDTYSTEGLAKGIILLQVQGRNVFVLRSEHFDAYRGGIIQLDYLHNGITGSRRQDEIEIEHGPNGWRALHEGTPFRFIKVLSKHFLGKTVGVKELEFLP